RRSLWNRYMVPFVLRCGWRAPDWIRLDDEHLQSPCGYDEEADIKLAIVQVPQHTKGSFERLATLWHRVPYLGRVCIPGSFVECGVWRGGAVAMMALAHLRSCQVPQRTLHLFDSFEGLPEPKAEVDGGDALQYARGCGTGKLLPIQACVGSLEDNQE